MNNNLSADLADLGTRKDVLSADPDAPTWLVGPLRNCVSRANVEYAKGNFELAHLLRVEAEFRAEDIDSWVEVARRERGVLRSVLEWR